MKLEAIATDYQATDIISKEDLEKVVNEVKIVFNVIATIRFNETLQDAVEINMLNTQKIVQMAHRIKNLKSFIHVSTLFSNCNQNEADEIIYNNAISYKELIEIADLSRKVENEKSSKLIFEHDFPNTYSLTKHFSEKLVYDQASGIAAGIFRPPIVLPNYKSLPGWTDNLNAFSGVVVTSVKGFSHCWLGREENPSNFAPVDYCINAIVASAWDVSEKFEKAKEDRMKYSIPIYNYMFKENNITFGRAFNLIPEGFSAPFKNSIYYYAWFWTSRKNLFLLLHFLLTTIPASFMDILAFVCGQKVIYRKIARKTKEFFLILSHFTLTPFKFGNENVKNLVKKVENMENFRDELDFDMKNIDWKEFSKNHQPGLKKYFFKEDMNNLEKMRKSYQR